MDLLGLLEVYHSTSIEAVKDILEHGYKGDFLWTGEKGAKAGGGQSWQLRNNQVIKLDVPDRLMSNAVEISYKQVHSYYEAGQGKFETPEKINAYRWHCVKDFMSKNPSNVFIVHPEKGRKPRWVVVKVNSINKSGIKILEVPGINATPASIPPLLREAGRNFNITKYVNIKIGLVGLSYEIGGYQLYTVRNSPKEITRVVYGWAGSYIGMKYGAAAAAGTTLIAGQMGPQIATPEEI